ncbi:2-succinyl-5-enolpyruvyl-6-hydroxy-3-cyclohexene-1-carboxylic-acid synthase [Sporolactobacillus shoreicorticis]|uniref:2-succinyl-5-enolpyruvyl-6-hydroxy-3-cyclohexene-1-carboxylate synthase n=1 Tax=Sporolactobacillus shoreicorticis TaxID=1923877 RepID=A0ABW5S6D8_9BACL|nr:2-succinyl-5-enolpyruvyl-6-hydroxy-3-cyclohexene-1-carboxylic-acid synthase [Sporolactobacillus shoreicorticis]MCO7125726.1 2-succinyl-5-enolpyruvyl-6-hydroxy-3-cyclohexene-1-carboxylic-acid synthase [Sporolactobacillus shoreicorticis]
MNHLELMTHYLSSFVHTLSQQNVKTAVISPGSRSTPLAILFEEHSEIQTFLDIDERSAGFLALGLAKASKYPVALICTSGTAAANYYPAIIEAYFSRVPLLVITSDRPYELQHVAAPQTVGQQGMYGNHVKQYFQLELSELDLSLLSYNQALASRAVAIANGLPKGPVHLNVPLREPLVPCRLNQTSKMNVTARFAVPVKRGMLTLGTTQLQDLSKHINCSKQGVIICGAAEYVQSVSGITEFAERAGFPILADPLSQLRRGMHSMTSVIETYDTFLRNEQIASSLKPDLIIRFGAPPVSKALKLWMQHQVCTNFVIDSGMEWRDPEGKATEIIYCDEQRFCEDLSPIIERKGNHKWLVFWRTINNKTKSVLRSIREEQTLSEEKVFLKLAEWLPEKANLFVGNSMPIRELDSFLFSRPQSAHIFANRGANGIDGVVSTAVGVALANHRAILVIGDLSFFHDMNGLLAAKQYHANLTILLINNDGGGIFSFLPQASDKIHFESLFGTPHGLDFSNVARLYGARYTKISNWEMFDQAMSASEDEEELTIIEIPTKRAENVEKHRMLQKCLDEQVKRETAYES